MIVLNDLALTENEIEDLFKWAAILFENAIRLMYLSNFTSKKSLDKELIIQFLEDKIREGIDHYEKDISIEYNIKMINEETQRFILCMIEMIKIEEMDDNDT